MFARAVIHTQSASTTLVSVILVTKGMDFTVNVSGVRLWVNPNEPD